MVEKKRAAVIGSGFGGIAAAIRLQAAGIDTVLFEARDLPGGRAYVYRAPHTDASGAATRGFVFDAGPTVITAPHCLEELFALANVAMSERVELLPVTPFYRLSWPDGDTIDYSGDGEAMLAQIGARNPQDVEGYLRFLDYSRKVFDKGYTDLVATPFLRFVDMIKVAPSLAWLRADRSVYQTVARYVQNEHVREALSFHSLLVGGNPFETSSIYTLIHHLERKWGVSFPRGGTGALVSALIALFESLGGELRLSTPVTSIEVASGKHLVTSTSSRAEAEPFDVVVSNADLHHTYARLYGDAGNRAALAMAKKLERLDWSMSLFVLYFGTDIQYDVAHHTVLFGPRYQGLLRDVFHGDALPDDFSLYLHAPTVTDPSLAPPGCATFYVLSPVPHLGNAKVDWANVGEAYADRLLAALERVLPDVRKHVVTRRWFTPRDFQTELAAYHGSAFSVAPKLTQSAYFRPHNKDPNIPGLYIVGAGTHPGAGLPGVINSAKATVSIVLRDLELGEVSHLPISMREASA